MTDAGPAQPSLTLLRPFISILEQFITGQFIFILEQFQPTQLFVDACAERLSELCAIAKQFKLQHVPVIALDSKYKYGLRSGCMDVATCVLMCAICVSCHITTMSMFHW